MSFKLKPLTQYFANSAHYSWRSLIILYFIINYATSTSWGEETSTPLPPSVSTPNESNPPLPTTSFSEKFLEKFPHLKQHIFVEPETNFYFGFSIAPLGILRDRMMLTANFFQIHYLSHFLDLELFSVSYAMTLTQPSYLQSNHFIFRMTPKFRIGKIVSLGPLIGYEFVSFSQITSKLRKNNYETKPEAFSTKGVIYGIGINENFDLESGRKLKISQILYNQSYSTEHSDYNWSYYYDLQTLNSDKGPIAAGFVVLLEIGLLF